MSRFFENINSSTVERQVEDAYNEALKAYFPGARLEYPYACDGYMETEADGKPLRLICEFKRDMDMRSKAERSKVLAQVLFYLKRFEDDGRPLPNVVFVGDMNECFAVHSNHLLKFLDFEGVDWTKAPSSAAENGALVAALAEDDGRNAFVWPVGPDFDFGKVGAQISAIASGTSRMIHITEHNVDKVFGMFRDRVLKGASKIPPNDLVGLFYGCVCEPESNYLHPEKHNVLVSGASAFRVDSSAFKAFRSMFEYVKAPSQKARLASISDRLIEDTNRRRKGEFYTPTPFVDEAHRRISAVFGPDWREKYVVVDPACGTGNLTRDYQFRELYRSTLEQAELDIGAKYNQGACAFRFDFLNGTDEELEAKAPGLFRAFRENRPIIWLANPPYIRANKKEQGGVGISAVNKLMNDEKIGVCSANLFTQFLYRIMLLKRKFNLTDCNLAFFCKPIYLTGNDFRRFRTEFLSEFKFEGGMLFNAGHFGDVATTWGINFSIWKTGETADRTSFAHDLVDLVDGDISAAGSKTLYNIDDCSSVNEWTKEPVAGLKTADEINLTSACKVSSGTTVRSGKNFVGNFGFYHTEGANCASNAQGISIMSAAFSHGIGHGISRDNFARCCSAFSARRLISGNWINDKDEYTKPNTDDPRYAEFESDALVFSLFDSNSQQSSLRNVEYKGRKWDVKNEFFWMSSGRMAELADSEGLDSAYSEAKAAPDRHMAKVLAERALSPEAKAVLDKAVELVEKSMKYRQAFDDDRPEYQCLNFDSGYYQLKSIWKTYFPEEFKEFRALVKALADKMRPMVYELGFLKA